MLQDQLIPINLGNGVDTKTDPKAVVAGKFLRVENGIYTNVDRVTKRNGYTLVPTTISGGGSLSSPKMIHGYNDELVAADSEKLYSYSNSQTAWVEKGDYLSTQLSRLSIDQSTLNSGYVDSVMLGNLAIYVWSTIGGASASLTIGSSVYLCVIDTTTDTVIYGPTAQNSALLTTNYYPFPVRVVLLGGTVPALAYLNEAATDIVMRTVSFPGSGVVTVSAAQSITTNYLDVGPFPIPGTSFDIAQTSTGGVIFYSNTTGVTVSTLDTSGAVTASDSIVDADATSPVHVSVNSNNGSIWVYWCDTNVTTDLVYAVYSSALAVTLAKTTVYSSVQNDIVTNIICVSNSATQQTVFYGRYRTTSSTNILTDTTIYQTVTSAGVVSSSTIYANGVSPFSNPVLVGSSYYAVFIYRGAVLSVGGDYFDPQSQPTFFILKISPVPASAFIIPPCAARFGSGIANTSATLANIIRFTPNLVAVSSTKISFPCGLASSTVVTGYYAGVNLLPAGAPGVFSYSFDFDGEDSFKPTNCCDVAVLNGGMISLYDGTDVSEFGFHLYPEIASLTASGASGLAAGTYSYIAIFQWTDALGNLHQSAPSLPVEITIASPQTITINVSAAYLSKKPGVSAALFRTQNGGSIYYRVDDPTFLTEASGIGAISQRVIGGASSFVDTLDDSLIAGNLQAYTYPASSVLENTTPPPSMILLAHNNRLWFVDAENPNTEWYTKSYSPGTGLSPSGFMTQTIDPKFGNITALAEMDEKLITLKENGIFVQSGDGVNDVGSGSTLSFPQVVPSDVGCSELKSVVPTPTGVMFKSLNGIYMIDRKLNCVYIGAEVEQYNSQAITSANIITGKSQIRFLCSTGLTLVYDYIFNKWSTFSNHTGISATDWNGTYVYLRTNGAIYKEASGTYTDNSTAYALLLQTSWLALGGIQGFQRVKRLIMLGDYANGASASHGISISAAYDFSTTFQTAISYLFGAASSSGVFQYRERLPIQKCDSISLLIQELTTGDSAEYIDLTNMSFEAGVKKGANKLGGTKSVG
jgi:hypothetical protein